MRHVDSSSLGSSLSSHRQSYIGLVLVFHHTDNHENLRDYFAGSNTQTEIKWQSKWIQTAAFTLVKSKRTLLNLSRKGIIEGHNNVYQLQEAVVIQKTFGDGRGSVHGHGRRTCPLEEERVVTHLTHELVAEHNVFVVGDTRENCCIILVLPPDLVGGALPHKMNVVHTRNETRESHLSK